MTVEEIFTKMASHMLDGVMIHEQLVHYHNFLHLSGYARFHAERCLEESVGYMRLYSYYLSHYNKLIPNVRVAAERCLEESVGYMRLYSYYLSHYNKLIPNVRVAQTNVIPKTWYSHTKKDVDSSTLRSSVKAGLEMWIEWEKDTQKLYQELYTELIELGEIASANYVSECINDVTEELKEAECYYLNKKIREYDIADIMDEQTKFSKEKCKEICKVIKESFD